MRLYLLPVSTRRTLLYCHRADSAASAARQTWPDWVQMRAARMWADWEKRDRGWQRKVVDYGNYAFRRIPYEEWGLKSVPPLPAARPADTVPVVYPRSLLSPDKVPKILAALATERDALHRRKMLWCFAAMPLTIPIGILPVIPNLPFFYLAYRAWSHYRALAGGKHIRFLVQNRLLTLAPSPEVDEVYRHQQSHIVQMEEPLPSTPEPTTETDSPDHHIQPPSTISSPSPSPSPSSPSGAGTGKTTPKSHQQGHHPDGETMLLSQEHGRKMTQALDLPQLEVELERAIWQVETAIKKQNDELRQRNSESGGGGESGEGGKNR